MADEAINLSPSEAVALAWRVSVKQLANYEMWLEWGDLPMLDEASFKRVERAVSMMAKGLARVADVNDRRDGIDSKALWEAAQ